MYAGKFEATWKRTSLTFDPDIQPEGASERLKIPLTETGVLKGVTLTAWEAVAAGRERAAQLRHRFAARSRRAWAWSIRYMTRG